MAEVEKERKALLKKLRTFGFHKIEHIFSQRINDQFLNVVIFPLDRVEGKHYAVILSSVSAL